MSRDKDIELSAIKANMEKLQDDQLELRSENLELYRRIRLLRATSSRGDSNNNNYNNNNNNNVNNVNNGETGTPSKLRARKDSFRINQSAETEDVLDLKYNSLYEAHIDPFKFEETDRNSIISRLNFLERGLVHLARYLLLDRWARHALIFYLFMIHWFAFVYFIQILNPLLIDEIDQIDASQKAIWSQQTLLMEEND